MDHRGSTPGGMRPGECVTVGNDFFKAVAFVHERVPSSLEIDWLDPIRAWFIEVHLHPSLDHEIQ